MIRLMALYLSLIFLVLVQVQVHAHDACFKKVTLQKNLEQISKVVQLDDVCERAFLREAEKKYEQMFPARASRESQLVEGKKLSGSKAEISILRNMLGKKPPAVWKKASQNCDTVLCALENLFQSKEAAYRVLSFSAEAGYVISLDQSEYPQGVEFIWPARDIRSIDRALSRMPKSFKKMPSLEVIRRSPDGYVYAADPLAAAGARAKVVVGNKVLNQGEIYIFERAMLPGSERLSYSYFIHELAHHYDFSHEKKHNQYASEQKDFYAISGWKKQTEVTQTKGQPRVEVVYDYNEGHKFVRDYASEDPAEDFAESLAYYVMQPRVLKRIDPKKYEYYRSKVFNGREFMQEEDLDLACLY